MERSELREYVEAALAQFGLAAEGNETVGTFSGGMKRRVSVAVSAMANPSVVYLDEPTTGTFSVQNQCRALSDSRYLSLIY